jgi:hypothetical protein
LNSRGTKGEIEVVLSSVTCYEDYGKVEVHLYTSLALSLNGGQQSASCPSCSSPRKEPFFPLAKRLAGPHSKSECCRQEKNFTPFLPGI